MALTLGENSYITLVEAEEYIATYGLEGTVEEAHLIRATSWLDRNFSPKWIGNRFENEQFLDWPRTYSGSNTSVDSDGNWVNLNTLPKQVKEATVEVALMLARGADLYIQPTPAVTEESIELDVLKSTKKFSSSYAQSTIDGENMYLVQTILRPLLKKSGESLKLVR